MKQKTNNNKKENLRPVPLAEMRQNVLKSGLCNELIAGVLTDEGEIPNIGGQNGYSNMQDSSLGQAVPIDGGGEMSHVPTDEEMEAYIGECRGKCTDGEMSIESLVCKVYDLINQNNALVDLIGKIQSGEAVYIGGEMQNPQGQMKNMQGQMQNQQGQMQMSNPQGQMPNTQGQMQNTQMQMQNPQMQGGYRFVGGKASEQVQNVPRSTGGTGGHAQKQAYIPKSQVEKMTREEIREMFDVIDRSRKEW